MSLSDTWTASTRRIRHVDVSPGFDVDHVMALMTAVLESGDIPLLPRVGGHEGLAEFHGVEWSAALLDEAAVILPTSGSTGAPKSVVLDAPALVSAAAATHEHLGGPGQWLLALPPERVAGWQVLTRSVVAGTRPVALDRSGPFTPEAFAAATQQMEPGHRHYVSLVPTQLHRLLTSAEGVAALDSFDAVLIGGSALDPDLRTQAEDAGVSLVATYGMTETGGGCVYDGVPLPGVQVHIDDQDRIFLGGPMLAKGYLDRPELSDRRFMRDHTFQTEDDEESWFLTDDVGELAADESGRQVLTVLGRADDIINTGGAKVSPHQTEAALNALPGVRECAVVGILDPEWGQRVAAGIVLDDSVAVEPAATFFSDQAAVDDGSLTTLVRDLLRDQLPAECLPQQVTRLAQIPMLTSGKVDRESLRQTLAGESGRI